jgi:hypothetical protein
MSLYLTARTEYLTRKESVSQSVSQSVIAALLAYQEQKTDSMAECSCSHGSSGTTAISLNCCGGNARNHEQKRAVGQWQSDLHYCLQIAHIQRTVRSDSAATARSFHHVLVPFLGSSSSSFTFTSPCSTSESVTLSTPSTTVPYMLKKRRYVS